MEDGAFILKLPSEMLLKILAELENIQDVYSFGLGNRHLYQTTLQRKFKLDAQRSFPRALIWAAIHGNKETAKMAIKAGTPLEFVPDYLCPSLPPFLERESLWPTFGTTALMLAAGYGHLNVVEFLLQESADAGAMDRHCRTPLALAASVGHAKVCQALLNSAGHTLSLSDEGDVLPDELAARYGHTSVVEVVCNHDPSAHRASRMAEAAARQGHYDTYRMILEMFPDVDADFPYESVMDSLIKSSDTMEGVGLLRFFLEAGQPVDVESLDELLETACRTLKPHTGPEVLRLLIDHGASMKPWWLLDEGYTNDTWRNPHAIQFFLSSGLISEASSTTEYSDPSGWSVLEQLVRGGSVTCLELVLADQVSASLDGNKGILSACNSDTGNAGMAKKLLGHYGMPDRDTGPYNSLVQFAWWRGDQELFRLVIGPDFDKLTQIRHSLAIGFDRMKDVPDDERLAVLELMIERGADPLAGESFDETPLWSACRTGSVACVRHLLSIGARAEDLLNVCLDGAATAGSLPIVMLIMEAAGPINILSEYRDEFPSLISSICRQDKLKISERHTIVQYLLHMEAEARSAPESQPLLGASPTTAPESRPLLELCETFKADGPPGRESIDPSIGAGELMELLIRAGTKVNVNRGRGKPSAIGFACSGQAFTAVEVLLARTADVNLPNEDSENSALVNAIAGKSASIIQKLLLAGAKPKPSLNVEAGLLFKAAVLHPTNPAIVRLLINAGGSIHPRLGPNHLVSMVQDATRRHNNSKSLELLLDYIGALGYVLPKLRVFDPDETVRQRLKPNCIRLLADRGLINYEARDPEGGTVLAVARHYGQHELVEHLESLGAIA